MKIMLNELYEIYKDKGITKVVGIESRGFVLGAALAVNWAPVSLCAGNPENFRPRPYRKVI